MDLTSVMKVPRKCSLSAQLTDLSHRTEKAIAKTVRLSKLHRLYITRCSVSRNLILLDASLLLLLKAGYSQGEINKEPWRDACADQVRRLRSAIVLQLGQFEEFASLPFVRNGAGALTQRIVCASEYYLREASFAFQLDDYRKFLDALVGNVPLEYEELKYALSAIRLVLLLAICDPVLQMLSVGSPEAQQQFDRLASQVNNLSHANWIAVLRTLVRFESTLLDDPAAVYGTMTERTKDQYRGAVSRIAREHGLRETDVARLALEMATEAGRQDTAEPRVQSHVGYYLVDEGVRHFAADGGARTKPKLQSCRSAKKRHIQHYCLLNAAFSVLLFAIACCVWGTVRVKGSFVFAALIALLILASESANRLIDMLLARWKAPRLLPELDFAKGIPSEHKTCVCVPTVLRSHEHLRRVMALMEREYLSTEDPSVTFVLLTDYIDSLRPQPTTAEHDLLVECRGLVNQLNVKYGAGNIGPFCLLHRERAYSATQQAWMGWERKRGKLCMFNELLSAGTNLFDLVEGDPRQLYGTRYVVSLDDNSRLVRFSVKRLAGMLAHPLNQLIRDKNTEETARGYGILQPFPCVESVGRWALGSDVLGPSCREGRPPKMVRHSFFDAFGECPYLGKGIYDAKACAELLTSTLPNDRILSHDTIEGGLVRTAFVEDIAVVEPAPQDLRAYYSRQHRWARGDWQNVMLLLSNFMCNSYSISLATKYWLCAFARRSLLPVARTVLLVAMLIGDATARGTLVFLLLLLFPDYLGFFELFMRALIRGQLWFQRKGLSLFLINSHRRELFLTVIAPHQALLIIDAVSRTIIRWLKKRDLLDWPPISLTESRKAIEVSVDFAALASFLCVAGLVVSRLRAHGFSLLWIIPSLTLLNPLLYLKIGLSDRR